MQHIEASIQTSYEKSQKATVEKVAQCSTLYLEQLSGIADKINRFDAEITQKSEQLQKKIQAAFITEQKKMAEEAEKQKIEIQGISNKLFGILEATNAQVASKAENLSKFEQKQTEIMTTVSRKMIDFQKTIDENSTLLKQVEERTVYTDEAVKNMLCGPVSQTGLIQATMVDTLKNFMDGQVRMYSEAKKSIRKELKKKYKDDKEQLQAMNKICGTNTKEDEKEESTSKPEPVIPAKESVAKKKEIEEDSQSQTSRQLNKGKAPKTLKVKRDPKAEKDALTSLLGPKITRQIQEPIDNRNKEILDRQEEDENQALQQQPPEII